MNNNNLKKSMNTFQTLTSMSMTISDNSPQRSNNLQHNRYFKLPVDQNNRVDSLSLPNSDMNIEENATSENH